MYYNEKLKEIREDKDLTQEQVANILKIKKQQYYRYENGINIMPIEYLITLCIFYQVSADYILGLPKGLAYPSR